MIEKWRALDKRWQYGGVIALVVLVIISVFLFKVRGEQTAEEFSVTTQSTSESQTASAKVSKERESSQSSQSVLAFADVKGAVSSPGIYPISDNMRVSDVVKLAGGFTKQADSNQVNLAQKVTDQMVIYVPKIGEEKADIASLTVESSSLVTSGSQAEPSGQVNINTADLSTLQTLNGVGAVKAQAIIDYRQENGAFQTIDDLKNVKGVGEKTFDSLKESITID